MKPITADELRRAFLSFFESKGHTVQNSSSLVPNDPTMLLTTAGMVQFKPYMLGEEKPPWPRATTVQKCFRTTDIDIIGTTTRHLTFFEMLGNFSLGDYFKEEAIPLAWELATTVFELEPDRIWVTVFETDDEAADIWRDVVGIPPERIQRMGEKDNFWAMGPTGPCGPCSELYYDRGPEFGEDGGPAHGGEERYIEFWNLVFMQYNRDEDGELHELPQKNIDTGAGLERILALLQGEHSVFETDVLRRIVAVAEAVTGQAYGTSEKTDISLRILAEHARAMTFLLADGVLPGNEGREYVLRRIIRRAVRHARLLGVEDSVTGPLVDATVETMGAAYPDLVRQHEFVRNVAGREEARFGVTLRRGLELLDDLLAKGDVSGENAFFLHDTLGFPVEVTQEIAGERGRTVDLDGFRDRMERQRRRARESRSAAAAGATPAGDGGAVPRVWRDVLEAHGATEFTGYQEPVSAARVLAVVAPPAKGGDREVLTRAEAGRTVDIVLDRTPFYAESGGQVGDTGIIESPDGALRVLDTVYGVPGNLVVHRCEVVTGHVATGSEATGRIDVAKRERTRRNHTGTHILHWALRDVLGEHVKQAGSHVSPDRLRFDFSHYEGVPAEVLARVETLANEEVLSNGTVRAYETTKEHAESIGAIAFFGDKYGDIVRVIEAGNHSVELCGGTHVSALGMIGPIKILGESSIGANVRRIEALTAEATFAQIAAEEARLRRIGELLRASPAEIPERVEKLLGQLKEMAEELDAVRARQAAAEAGELAASAADGVLVARKDGATPDELRRLVAAARDAMGSGVAVFLGLSPDGTKAGLAVAVSADLQEKGVTAAGVASDAAKALGGGTARNPDLVTGGGPRVENIESALELARAGATRAVAGAAGTPGAPGPGAE